MHLDTPVSQWIWHCRIFQIPKNCFVWNWVLHSFEDPMFVYIIEGIYMIRYWCQWELFTAWWENQDLREKSFWKAEPPSTAEKCSRKDYSGMEDRVQDTLAGWKGSGLCQSSSALTWGSQRSHRQRWHKTAEQLEGAALEASFTLLLIFCPSFFALQSRI